MNVLESQFRTAKAAGRKLLVPYVTGGVTDDWTDLVRAAADAGADAIEIGLPFSDPALDGPVIQQSSYQAITRGAAPRQILDEVAGLGLELPLIAFTYANLALHDGADVFCSALVGAGVSGMIVPDVPVDEAGPLSAAADRHKLDLVLLASPATETARRIEIVKRSRGFVYAMSVMAPTGEQSELHDSARPLVTSLQELTDLPVLLGFGISSTQQAAEAAAYADGVVVGSALMRQVLDGRGPADLAAFLATIRAALDAV